MTLKVKDIFAVSIAAMRRVTDEEKESGELVAGCHQVHVVRAYDMPGAVREAARLAMASLPSIERWHDHKIAIENVFTHEVWKGDVPYGIGQESVLDAQVIQ